MRIRQLTMTPLSIQFASPPSSFFAFPPDPHPPALVPKSNGFSFANPFNVDPSTYQSLLSPTVPITFAAGYMTLVFTANAINRRRKHAAWPISRTRAFFVFNILHNVLLALYSGITCAAMVRAMHVSIPSPVAKYGIPGTVDSLCKMSGPRGLGDAVTFDPKTNQWSSKNADVLLGPNDLPDTADVGRIWNEGLAFWGWVFYLSKFYEVVDTLLILARGKRSPTLQTYHHAGAMLCMWAGIRYMSAPIWMFCLVNSGIHTLMYTYYTLATLGVKVPRPLKQTLTTMQIMQFIVGAIFAAAHLFVSYTVPVTVSYKVARKAESVAAAASSLANTASASSLAASATGASIPWLNKLAAWAAGSPGLAENVLNNKGERFATGSTETPLEDIQYKTEYETVHCLDTSGQAFAIWLNCLYLAPLTALFVRFFIKAYVFGEPRQVRSDKKTHGSRRLSASGMSAWKETSRSVEAIGRQVERSISTMGGEVEDGGQGLSLESVRERLKQAQDSSATSTGEETEEAVEEREGIDRSNFSTASTLVNGSAH